MFNFVFKHTLIFLEILTLLDSFAYNSKLILPQRASLAGVGSQISIVMDIFDLFGIPKNQKTCILKKTRPLSAESCTGYVSKSIWITIMSKL